MSGFIGSGVRLKFSPEKAESAAHWSLTGSLIWTATRDYSAIDAAERRWRRLGEVPIGLDGQERLWAALSSGRVIGSGRRFGDVWCVIPQQEWAFLTYNAKVPSISQVCSPDGRGGYNYVTISSQAMQNEFPKSVPSPEVSEGALKLNNPDGPGAPSTMGSIGKKLDELIAGDIAAIKAFVTKHDCKTRPHLIGVTALAHCLVNWASSVNTENYPVPGASRVEIKQRAKLNHLKELLQGEKK